MPIKICIIICCLQVANKKNIKDTLKFSFPESFQIFEKGMTMCCLKRVLVGHQAQKHFLHFLVLLEPFQKVTIRTFDTPIEHVSNVHPQAFQVFKSSFERRTKQWKTFVQILWLL